MAQCRSGVQEVMGSAPVWDIFSLYECLLQPHYIFLANLLTYVIKMVIVTPEQDLLKSKE